ncbi:MAG: VOC family protein [Phycisphaerales bacterium]|nr:VOC family protein [Phycisphaerales bacterium]
MPVKPIPDGYHSITPYLVVDDGAKAIEFYTKAFGATELFRFPGPGGKLVHAEMKIGDSPFMLADENPQMGAVSPKSLGGSPVGILIYLKDVDAQFATAVAAGAKVVRPLQDQFYGDRSGTVHDPFGHKWTLATHVEDISVEETNRRFDAMMKKPDGK